MASRFWVAGGNGFWSSTTNWSATSGGASGASVPGSADTATFNAASTTVTATVDSNVTIQTLTMTGFTGTLAFGTNTISVNGTGLVYTANNTFTVTGTPIINVTSSGSTAITVTPGLPNESNAISFNFIAGTYALSFMNANAYVKNVDFTGFSGTWGATAIAIIYGNLTLSTGMTLNASASPKTFGATSGTKTITTNGKTLDFPIIFDGIGGTWQLQDALTVGSTRTTTLTNGVLDLNNKTITTGTFDSTNSNTRAIYFGSGNITCNAAGGIMWTMNTATGFTLTGTPVVNILNSSVNAAIVASGPFPEAYAISFNFPIGTAALTFLATASHVAKNVNFTGFTGTWNARTVASTIYGNLTLSSGMTFAASTGILTFGATSGTQAITTNGITVDGPITINGVGGTTQLQDALTMGTTRTLTHTNGTLDLNGKTLTVGTAYTTATGTKNLTFNAGTLICPTASTTAFNNAVPVGYTTTAGTGTGKISMTAATAKTFVGGGSTYNCTLSNDGAGALTVSGSNTFTTIANGVQPTAFVFPSSTTTTVSNWNVLGTSGSLVTITSSTSGTAATLSKASGTVSSDYLSLKDSAATGGAAWYAGTHSTNVSGNSGWIFSAAPVTSAGSFFFMF